MYQESRAQLAETGGDQSLYYATPDNYYKFLSASIKDLAYKNKELPVKFLISP
jgi:hypothetical protein